MQQRLARMNCKHIEFTDEIIICVNIKNETTLLLYHVMGEYMSSYTYKQESKNQVRHTVIRNAVELLTIGRSEACCVRHSYVRDLYDYFLSLPESHEQTEAEKIEQEYIREWEHIHSNLIGYKRPDELSVCYLSGPEPENDFNELVDMGVLPQNIWAFENERNTYLQALDSLDRSTFMQPKIVKTSIERFFENSPKKFDIVYIDACASLISDQHALRCVASLFQNHRLNSPGILITNFAYPSATNAVETMQYIDLISRYNIIQHKNASNLINESGVIRFKYDGTDINIQVEQNLEDAYGEFVTAMVCNAASITVPALRFCNSTYLQSISTTDPTFNDRLSYLDVNTIRNNTLYRFLASNSFLNQQGASFPGIERANKLAAELSGISRGFDLLSCLRKLHEIKTKTDGFRSELQDVIDFFDTSSELYQFLDKPNRVLFFDSVINQLSYPMHYVSDKAKRLTYVAKDTRMFTDMLLFDECRYIYDWIPAIHQIPKAFSNPSWQYTFRFGLDGLIKQRINYNNEFFFQGSVVSKTTSGFEAKLFPNRIKIN